MRDTVGKNKKINKKSKLVCFFYIHTFIFEPTALWLCLMKSTFLLDETLRQSMIAQYFISKRDKINEHGDYSEHRFY